MNASPRIGVSACLLGAPVRFNGDHARHDWVADVLAKQVELVPFCPEMAAGLGSPRPALRLNRDASGEVRLVTAKTGEDLSDRLASVIVGLTERAGDLDGFVLKKNSPSCGDERVRVYSPSGFPTRDGRGLFAAELRRRHPGMPIIEEGRLTDPDQRENFVLRVYAYARLRATAPSAAAIQDLHRRHKFMLLEHSPKLYARLGRIVGNSERLPPAEVLRLYGETFMKAFETLPTPQTRTNVLEHVMGFLRGKADPVDRRQLAELIAQYHAGEVPFIAPLTVVFHLARKLGVRYLEEQFLFSPYPRRLGVGQRL